MSLEGNPQFISVGIRPRNQVSLPLNFLLQVCLILLITSFAIQSQSVAQNTGVVNENQEEKEKLMKVIGSTAPTVKPSVKVSRGGISSNAYAQGSRQNVGNVITDRTTSRVTQPPGGRSSISLF